MFNTLLMILLFCLGVVALVGGANMVMRVRQTRSATAKESPPKTTTPGLPPAVSQTTPEGRAKVIDRGVFLALEMSRVDGAISEMEMRAIEDFLSRNCPELSEGEPEIIVRRVLRATIQHSGSSQAIQEVARHADVQNREMIVRMLAAVGQADGDLNEQESHFLDTVKRSLEIEAS